MAIVRMMSQEADVCPALGSRVRARDLPRVIRLSWPSRLVIGAAIAVAIVGAVRGLPDKEEREAAQGAPCPSWAARKRHRSRRRRDHAGDKAQS